MKKKHPVHADVMKEETSQMVEVEGGGIGSAGAENW